MGFGFLDMKGKTALQSGCGEDADIDEALVLALSAEALPSPEIA